MLTKKRTILDLHIKNDLCVFEEYHDQDDKTVYVVRINNRVCKSSNDIFQCVRYILNKWEEANR